MPLDELFLLLPKIRLYNQRKSKKFKKNYHCKNSEVGQSGLSVFLKSLLFKDYLFLRFVITYMLYQNKIDFNKKWFWLFNYSCKQFFFNKLNSVIFFSVAQPSWRLPIAYLNYSPSWHCILLSFFNERIKS